MLQESCVPCLPSKTLSRLYPAFKFTRVPMKANYCISYALSCMCLKWTGFHTDMLSFLFNKAFVQ